MAKNASPGMALGTQAEQWSCVVCFDQTQRKLCATACGHVFHRECLERWLDTAQRHGMGKCPVCMQKLLRAEHVRRIMPLSVADALPALVEASKCASVEQSEQPLLALPTQHDEPSLTLKTHELCRTIAASRDERARLQHELATIERRRQLRTEERRHAESRLLKAQADQRSHKRRRRQVDDHDLELVPESDAACDQPVASSASALQAQLQAIHSQCARLGQLEHELAQTGRKTEEVSTRIAKLEPKVRVLEESNSAQQQAAAKPGLPATAAVEMRSLLGPPQPGVIDDLSDQRRRADSRDSGTATATTKIMAGRRY